MSFDEITAFFDRLTPEDFMLATSAESEEQYPAPVCDGNAWATFRLRMNRLAYERYEAMDRWPYPQAILHAPTLRRLFTPDADETIRDFFDRLAGEAREMSAIWCSISMISPATIRTGASGKPSMDFSDDDSVRAAIVRGDLVEQYVVFSANRQTAEAYCTAWPIGEEGALGQPFTGRGNNSKLFMEVLAY